MTFEDALIKLKAGHQVARKIWVDLRILSANHIVIQLTDDEYAADDYEFQASDYDTDSLDAEYEDYLDEFGYTASSNDLLATDWVHGHRTKITP